MYSKCIWLTQQSCGRHWWRGHFQTPSELPGIACTLADASIIGDNRLYIRERLTPLLCLSQFCARLSEWYLWRSLVLGTRSENQKMDLMETIYEEGKELISAPHWYWYWSLLPADIAHFFGATINGKYEDIFVMLFIKDFLSCHDSWWSFVTFLFRFFRPVMMPG